VRVPRARDGGAAAVPVEDARLGLPHERGPGASGGADERDRDGTERRKLRRLLLEPLGPPGVRHGSRPHVLDQLDLALRHRCLAMAALP
jgi:hypothetical protein